MSEVAKVTNKQRFRPALSTGKDRIVNLSHNRANQINHIIRPPPTDTPSFSYGVSDLLLIRYQIQEVVYVPSQFPVPQSDTQPLAR